MSTLEVEACVRYSVVSAGKEVKSYLGYSRGEVRLGEVRQGKVRRSNTK